MAKNKERVVSLARQVIDAGLRLSEEGLPDGASGNISLRPASSVGSG